MKRLTALFLAVLCCIGVLSSCSKKTEYDDKPDDMASEKKEYDIPVNSELSYDYDFSKYLTFPDYKSYALEYNKVQVSDSTIKNYIYDLRFDKADKKSEDDRAVQNGDIVTVSYTGTIKGSDQSVGSSTGTNLTVGEGRFIPDFEAGILGLKKGEKKTFDAEFPNDYSVEPEYAGKTASFSVEILAVYTGTMPELNDAFAASLGYENVSNIQELNDYLKKAFKESADYQTELNKQNAFYKKLVEDTTVISYPEKEYKYYSDMFEKNERAKSEATHETFETTINKNYGSTEAYEKARRDDTEKKTKEDMIIYYLKEVYNVELSKDDFNNAFNYYYENNAPDYGITDRDDFYDKFGNSIAHGLLMQNVIETAVKDVPDVKSQGVSAKKCKKI